MTGDNLTQKEMLIRLMDQQEQAQAAAMARATAQAATQAAMLERLAAVERELQSLRAPVAKGQLHDAQEEARSAQAAQDAVSRREAIRTVTGIASMVSGAVALIVSGLFWLFGLNNGGGQ